MKLLKNLRNRLKIWTINELFKIYFGTFYYPFESEASKLLRMKDEERMIFMNAVYNFAESKAYRIIMQEQIRTFYTELATKPSDDIMLSAYRLTLMYIKDFDKHIKEIHDEYKNLIG